MSEMISFGAGVNSVAMTIMLVNDGWRGPIVFADTGGEHPETYCYLEYFERWLAERGLGIIRLVPGSEWHRSMSQVSLEQYCLRENMIPLLAVRWCSSRWKGRPCDRWAKAHGITTQFLGFSADEARRALNKPDYLEFPLIDALVNREGCRQIILKAGLQCPPKSSCFFCPGQTIGEWRRLYYEYPELYERARCLEHATSKARNKKATLNSHYSLDEMERRGWDIQIEMDLSQWLPCACSL